MKRSCISSGWFLSFAFSNNEYRRQWHACSVLIDDRLRAAFGHRFFRAPVVDMRLDVFLAVELFGEVEAIERAYHRPAGDHISEAGIDLRMIRRAAAPNKPGAAAEARSARLDGRRWNCRTRRQRRFR